MKRTPLPLLVVAVAACGDVGMTDADSSTDSTATSASGSDSEGGTTEGADSSEGTDTTDQPPPDPQPILEREPLPTHVCGQTRVMTQVGGANSRFTSLLELNGEYFVLHPSNTLTLAKIALDGTRGDEAVLEANEPGGRPTAVVADGTLVALWSALSSDESMVVLRYASLDDDLGPVVAPKDISGIGATHTRAAATVPAAAGGIGLLFGESGDDGQTRLRFVHLDTEGEPTAPPLDVAEVGPLFSMVTAGAALTSDGGYAVSYTSAGASGTEVFFVILDADGEPRFAPRRISRAAEDGWTAELGEPSRSTVLTVGDRHWVAFTEEQGTRVVRVAIVDGEGQSEDHLLQAPVADRNHQSPSFVALDGRVGLMWTSGSVITVCVGCISDDDLHFVLLDPEAIIPASNVATQQHHNGIVSPLGAAIGLDILSAASLDFHALSYPATGALRCEPTG